jgi:DNA-directed RNA polymerase specialized sigma24 family protein
VFLEFTRKTKTEELPDTIAQIEIDTTETETDYRCLNKCLKELKPEQRKLIISYYKGEKLNKIKRRKDIEQELGITNKALRVRIFRIKNFLHECILNCKNQKSNETL